MPKLTIITALHCDTDEKVAWFGECAASVLAQDFKDWEWVIVDDDSPRLPDVPDDPRIRTVRASKRQGPAMCRNTAVALATADAILPLDGDDVLTAGALSRFWAAWNPRLFVYGDIQILEHGQPGRTIVFPPYTFEATLKFKGNVPVTALHSKAAWKAGGGWKARFGAGLEDLEYWISLGAAGYCGKKIDGVGLMYRKHPESRSGQMRRALLQQDMERKIEEYHKDIYEGRRPMGCCGGKGKSRAQPTVSASGPRPTPLVDAGASVWVRYNGRKNGEFQVRSLANGKYYKISGTGHRLEIDARDAATFQRYGRGKDFTVGIPAPETEEYPPTPPPVTVAESEYKPGEPELAEIVRLDDPAAREPEPVQIIQEDLAAAQEELEQLIPKLADEGGQLARMEFKGVRGREAAKEALEGDGWTVQLLTHAEVEDLTPYPGVGKVAATHIITEANRLWSEQG